MHDQQPQGTSARKASSESMGPWSATKERARWFLTQWFSSGNANATGIGWHAQSKALAVLAKNGMSAHYYMAPVNIDDAELAEALRFLSSAGYLITHDSSGALVGKVATVPTNKDERAEQRRAQLHLVKTD
jgi:hypothetical protein